MKAKPIALLLVFVILASVTASGCLGGKENKEQPTSTATLSVSASKKVIVSGTTAKYSLLISVSDGQIKSVTVQPVVPQGVAYKTSVSTNGNTAEVKLLFNSTKGFEGAVPITVKVMLSDGQVLTKTITIPVKITEPKFGHISVPMLTQPLNFSNGQVQTIELTFVPHDSVKYKIEKIMFDTPEWVNAEAEVSGDKILVKLKFTGKPPAESGYVSIKVMATVSAYNIRKTVTANVLIPYQYSISEPSNNSGEENNTAQSNTTKTSWFTVKSAEAYIYPDDNGEGKYFVILNFELNQSVYELNQTDLPIDYHTLTLNVNGINVTPAYYNTVFYDDGTKAMVEFEFVADDTSADKVTLNLRYNSSNEPVRIPVKTTITDEPVIIAGHTLDKLYSGLKSKGIKGIPVVIGNSQMISIMNILFKMFFYAFTDTSQTNNTPVFQPGVILPYDAQEDRPIATVVVPSVDYKTKTPLTKSIYIITPYSKYTVYTGETSLPRTAVANEVLPVYFKIDTINYGSFYVKEFIDTAFITMFNSESDENIDNIEEGTYANSEYSPSKFDPHLSLITEVADIVDLSKHVDIESYFKVKLEFRKLWFNGAISKDRINVDDVSTLVDLLTDKSDGVYGIAEFVEGSNNTSYTLDTGMLPLAIIILPKISAEPINDSGYTVINGKVYKYTVSGTDYSLKVAGNGEYYVPTTPKDGLLTDENDTQIQLGEYNVFGITMLPKVPGNVNDVHIVVNGNSITLKYIDPLSNSNDSTSDAGYWTLQPFGDTVVLNVIIPKKYIDQDVKVIVDGKEVADVTAIPKDILATSTLDATFFSGAVVTISYLFVVS